MALTYTWAITGLKLTTVGDKPDYVVQSYWSCEGEDENGNTGKFSGATPFEANPSQQDFTPYDQLTEAQVLGWIQAVVVGSYWDHVNEQIAKQIAEKIDPVTDVNTFPWSPPPEDTPPA